MTRFWEAINVVASSLRDEPDKWSVDRFRVTNRELGCSVWIANGVWGLHIEVGGAEWGGVTFASVFFGWLIPWRVKLYRAAKRIPINRLLAKARVS